MAVKIRLTRMGKIRAPFYRVVVADSRTRRDGRAIEQIGIYQPTRNPSVIEIDSDRAQYWLSVGAQPTDQVRNLLKLTGDWQKFTGEGEAVNTVQPQPEKEAYVAPNADSVIKEAITKKGSDKAEVETEDEAADDAAKATEAEYEAEAVAAEDNA
ncbi:MULTISPECIES: 30S ribosomal protein S16 [Brevibacterium]|uniref:Small ribosomal subunit protein bS16 n=1 Tax=Brevibacterium casei TaxID=33889 RepID=A0A7T4DI13_9MICO|nr:MULTISPECIES: 30S ribosomal protein S16 [Brevibacterium]QQB14032.1 30S ribosomal protein S16 [Brevibacterium casei]